MENYVVKGFSADGTELFKRSTKAPNDTVAKMYVSAELKANVATVAMFYRTERMEAEKAKGRNR